MLLKFAIENDEFIPSEQIVFERSFLPNISLPIDEYKSPLHANEVVKKNTSNI